MTTTQDPTPAASGLDANIVRNLQEHIDHYWELAFAEGKEGRTHDTKNGDAMKCRYDIEQAIKALAAQPAPGVGGDDIERVAIALYTVDDCTSANTWNDLPDYGKDRFRDRAQAAIDTMRRPFAFCCAEGGGRIEGCSCVNKDHGLATFDPKRPSVESLWQAFWAAPHDEREWDRPIGTNGKPMPMTLISFKYEVVRAAFELDAQRASQEELK